MSEVKEMGLLESMKAQHAAFLQQRDQAQVNFQQLVGAIFALESMIKQHEEKLVAALKEQVEGVVPAEPVPTEPQGVSENEEAC
jgi:hypothetical protein